MQRKLVIRRLFAAFALAVGAGVAPGAAAEDRNATAEGPVEFWRMEVPNAWGLRQPTEKVIRTSVEFKQVWEQLWQGYEPFPRLPPVDFAKEAIVVIAMGAQQSGGYRIRTESIAINNGTLDIVYATTAPGTGCVTNSAMTAPAEVLRFALPAPKERFRARPQVTNCR